MAGRDTAKFYADQERRVAPGHLDFALTHGGESIHDAAAATGDYVEALLASGRDCTGSDLNGEYVAIAQARGLPVVTADASALDMSDNSVDSVLLFEILEHIAASGTRRAVLTEARRVARSQVLITVPNSTHLELLSTMGLTYEHMLDRDHKVFYTEETLRADLEPVFSDFHLEPREELVERMLPSLVRGFSRPRVAADITPRMIKRPIHFRFYVRAAASS